ncbi:MAG: RpiB/LacA/LacB family sugar-phosphate isomerase [bacterium]
MHTSVVYLGSDHGGFAQKARLLEALQADGCEVVDCGGYTPDAGDDYPDFAAKVGEEVSRNSEARGILLCRSGEGMEMAANKIKGIRAALAWNTKVAEETRKDNDANVLVMPSDFVSEEETLAMARVFLATEFSNEERHVRRLQKLHALEGGSYES